MRKIIRLNEYVGQLAVNILTVKVDEYAQFRQIVTKNLI